MLFNSYVFLFLFLPVMLLGWYLCRNASIRVKNLFLLLSSLLFYSWEGIRQLPVLLFSMGVNYAFARGMEHTAKKKGMLTAGVVFDLGMLVFFKALGTLPLGISFFTFTQLAYLTECYKGQLAETDFLSYGVYVSWFPKIMQGPIALPQELLPSLSRKEKKAFTDWEGIYRNVYLFVLGLFKKVLIADTFGKAVDWGYGSLASLNSWDALIVMLSYTLQLYFDFSGYCDMAMGVSGLFGIKLPLNFASPYKAADILEFWKGWHISLTRFFTRYLYIPLGGNRKGKFQTYVNCLLVFFFSGIWHGNGVQFIVWGMMHGTLYVLTRFFKERRAALAGTGLSAGLEAPEEQSRKKTGCFRGVRVLLTFLYVNIAWVFFRAPSLKEAAILLKTMFGFHGGRVSWNLADCFNLDEFWYVIKVLGIDSWQYSHYILMILILAAVLFVVFFGKNAAEYVKGVKPGIFHGVLMAVLFVWSVLSISEVSTFLYVNF